MIVYMIRKIQYITKYLRENTILAGYKLTCRTSRSLYDMVNPSDIGVICRSIRCNPLPCLALLGLPKKVPGDRVRERGW